LAQDRLGPIPANQLTEQQGESAADFVAARGQPTGPWIVLMRSPEVMSRARGLSDYLRYQSILPGWLREFVILMTARQWSQSYEWNAHYKLAVDEGSPPKSHEPSRKAAAPKAWSRRRRSSTTFAWSCSATKASAMPPYARALDRFGEQGIVETVSLMGYYTMISMVLNTRARRYPQA